MPVSAEYASLDDDFVEVRPSDFAPTHDFDSEPELTGRYEGSRTVTTKNGDRLVHSFSAAAGLVDAWGTAVLNSRLEGLEGARVKVIKTGKKLGTNSGYSAWEFRVLVAKGTLPR